MPFERDEGENPFQLQFDLQAMMQDKVGIVRKADELEEAIEYLRVLRQRATCVKVMGNREYNPAWHTYLDLHNLLTISEAITVAALERRESRGAHFREDYPEKEPESGKYNLVIKKNEEGKMQVIQERISQMREDLQKIIEELK
jgi:succinate dehydrogenase / fumarate reductase flavoprotein subunit